MAIILKNSWNVPPVRWGSFADTQYAIWQNLENIYQVDPKTYYIILPLFWGLPIINYGNSGNQCTNYGSVYKNGYLNFNGTSNYINTNITVPAESQSISLLVDKDGSDNGWFVTQRGGGGDTFQCWGRPDSVDQLMHYWNGTTTITSTILVKNNTLNQIVAVHDSSNVLFYINGDFDVSRVLSLGAASTEKVKIQADSVGGYANGSLKEVRITNTTYTAEQIAKFNDLPYGLYQKVIKTIYSIPVSYPDELDLLVPVSSTVSVTDIQSYIDTLLVITILATVDEEDFIYFIELGLSIAITLEVSIIESSEFFESLLISMLMTVLETDGFYATTTRTLELLSRINNYELTGRVNTFELLSRKKDYDLIGRTKTYYLEKG